MSSGSSTPSIFFIFFYIISAQKEATALFRKGKAPLFYSRTQTKGADSMEDDNLAGNFFYIEEPPIEFDAYEKGKEEYGDIYSADRDTDENGCAG